MRDTTGKTATRMRLLGAAGVALAVVVVMTWVLIRARHRRVPVPPVPGAMLVVPGGPYTIGRDDGHAWSRPAHTVTLDSFAIGKTEVTIAEYARFAAATHAAEPWREVPDSLLPVTGARWAEASAFCAWRYDGGRLPSEAEWEAAARGASGLAYPWGSTWQAGRANTAGAGTGLPVRVGSYPSGATASGGTDFVGNVWEWTSSRATAYPGGIAPPSNGDDYVIRGGAFNTPDEIANATRRSYLPATVADRSVIAATGFRCAAPLVVPSDAANER